MPIADFRNSTELDSDRLLAMCGECVVGWRTGNVTLRVRYSRGADFSGTCVYSSRKVFVNLGRHLVYPYRMGTHVACSHTARGRWIKPIYTIELIDGYQVVLFVFLHEIFHLLVKRAGRNTRQKESMCDRFAARILVDRFGVVVCDEEEKPVARHVWDFQDVEGFVAAARGRRLIPQAATRPPERPSRVDEGQLLLFPV